MPELETHGARIHYETDGSPTSPAILLIHAGIATLRMWDPQVEALAKGHYVIRFDCRGFGETTAESFPYTDVADAITLLDHLGVEQAVVVGCSRGGGTTIDMALAHPDRVRGIVTIGAGVSGFEEPPLTPHEEELFAELEAAEEAQDWVRLLRLEAEVWDFGPERRADDLDPTFVAKAYELALRNLAAVETQPPQLPVEVPAFGRLGEIRVPALVMIGDWDVSPMIAAYEHLLEFLPTAVGYRFDNAAHIPNVEQPEEFERALLRWLETNAL